MAILDDRNSLSMAFLAISDQYEFFFLIFTKWPPAPILDVQNSFSIAFLAILYQNGILICFEIFDKMAAGGNFGCSRFTFDRISGHNRSIWIYFLQNGRRRTFWMFKNHF